MNKDTFMYILTTIQSHHVFLNNSFNKQQPVWIQLLVGLERLGFKRHTKAGTDKWIGISSNGIEGCKERWNNTYKNKGLNKMMPLYKTGSDGFRRNLERELISLLESDLENINHGGGGNYGSPPYIVYAVWKE